MNINFLSVCKTLALLFLRWMCTKTQIWSRKKLTVLVNEMNKMGPNLTLIIYMSFLKITNKMHKDGVLKRKSNIQWSLKDASFAVYVGVTAQCYG